MKTAHAYRLVFIFIITLGLQACSTMGSKVAKEQVDVTNGAFADLVLNGATGQPLVPGKSNEAKNEFDRKVGERLKSSTVEADLKKAIANANSEVLKTQLQFRLALYHTLRGTGGDVIKNAWAPVANNIKNLPSRERIITDSRTALIFWYGDGMGAHRFPPRGIYRLDRTGTPTYARDILGIWPKNTPTPDTLPDSYKTAGYDKSPVGQAEKGLRAALEANNQDLAFYFAVLMDDMILRTYRARAFKDSTAYWSSLVIHANDLSRRAFPSNDIANYKTPTSDDATNYRRHHLQRIGPWLKDAGKRLNITQSIGW